MKRYNRIYLKGLLFSGLLCLSTGCTDFLTRDNPIASTDDDFWETQQECENALGTCKLWVTGAWGGGDIAMAFQDGASDNAYFTGNFDVRIQQLGNGSLLPPSNNNNPGSWEYQFYTWNDCYRKIRNCCRLLDHIDKAYFTQESERARMKAEAKVWRAWYHIRLLKWYGRNDGIPYVDKVLLPSEIYVGRTPVAECLAKINAELDGVINSEDLPFIWDEGRRDRMSRSVALTLKMDVNFQFKQYDIAKAAASKLIESKQFELYYSNATDNNPGKNYRDLFTYIGKQNKERILYKGNGLSGIFFRCMSGSFGGQGVMNVLKSFVDTYETADGLTIQSLSTTEKEAYEKNPTYGMRDPRLNVSIFVPGDNTGLSNYTFEPFNPDKGDYIGRNDGIRSGYMIKKYITEDDRAQGGTGGNLDFMIYRYAEVLLNYVECLVETGKWNDPEVATYINMIRKRAGMPDMDPKVYNSEDKVRELYRRERRVELCFEGKRYDDIRRWGIGKDVMNGPIYGAWNPKTETYIKLEERQCTFPKYDSWPLPQQEVTANTNISQPTGW